MTTFGSGFLCGACFMTAYLMVAFVLTGLWERWAGKRFIRKQEGDEK